MTKQFILTFHLGQATTWVVSDSEIANELKRGAEQIGALATRGERPAVSVEVTNKPEGQTCKSKP